MRRCGLLHAWLAVLASCSGQLVRREGVAVGHRQTWALAPGASVDVVTLSLRPLIFEVEGFLSAEEADHIRALATEEGLGDSYTLASSATKDRFRLNDYDRDGVLSVEELILMIDGLVDAHVGADDVRTMIERLGMDPDGDGAVSKQHLAAPERWMDYLKRLLAADPAKRSRHSDQVWIYPRQMPAPDPVLESLQARVAALTQLPEHVVRNSDSLQVVRYGAGGHYTTHYDSGELAPTRACCHITRPFRSTSREQLQHQSCRLCRFATVLYALNNARGAGGETAFPLVPNGTLQALDGAQQREEIIGWRHTAASREGSYCGGPGVLRARPAKGSALLWYNHDVTKAGALGASEPLAMHAGCPLHAEPAEPCFGCEPEEMGEGEQEPVKWIANHWIEASDDPAQDLDLAETLRQRAGGKAREKKKGGRRGRKGKEKRRGVKRSDEL